MDDSTRRCPGCALEMPREASVNHGTFHSSPECWSVFTEVLTAEYENAPLFGKVHQTTVDTYAVQHAGGRHPDKSVDVHLVGLHLVLVRGFPATRVHPYLRRLVGTVSSWPHLEPPEDRGELTILDVALAGSSREHALRVREWAERVWSVWGPSHEAIAALAARCFGRPAGTAARR